MKLPLNPRDIPNIISVGRILLTIPVIYLLLSHEYGFALWVFAAAGLSDALDGFLAKQFKWQSRLGGILDPLADKALLVTSFLVLGATGLIPVWLVVAAVCRDLIIMGGALYYDFMVEDLQPAPTLISKLNTLLQILLVVFVVMDAGPLRLPPLLLESMQWLLLVTIVVSGGHYVYVWTRKAAEKGWRE